MKAGEAFAPKWKSQPKGTGNSYDAAYQQAANDFRGGGAAPAAEEPLFSDEPAASPAAKKTPPVAYPAKPPVAPVAKPPAAPAGGFELPPQPAAAPTDPLAPPAKTGSNYDPDEIMTPAPGAHTKPPTPAGSSTIDDRVAMAQQAHRAQQAKQNPSTGRRGLLPPTQW